MARTILRVRRSFWRALSWLTLDNISKIAAIGTPIIVGLVGWYSTEIWKARNENIATYEKTTASIGKLSVLETTAQRDALFSIIQLGRVDLLKRVSSYIEARITTEMDREKQKLQDDRTISSVPERTAALIKILTKYRDLRSEIFQPMVLGAIAAGDISVAQSLVEAVPGVLKLERHIPISNNFSAYEPWNLLDEAVQARSQPMVRFLLQKGMPVNYWTVNLAIDGRDNVILDLVAQALPKKSGVVRAVWEHAARAANPSQIRVLARNDLGKGASGTPTDQTPIVSIAANQFRYEILGSLFEAGFSPYAATLDQRKEVISEAADAYRQTWLNWSVPDPQPFGKTILALCHRYMEEGVTISKIVPELELGDQFAKLSANTVRGDVLHTLFEGMNVNAIDCAASFYEFAKLDKAEKTSILMEQAIGEKNAALFLIDRYQFPIDGVLGAREESIGMRAAARNDIALISFLMQHNVDLSRQDKEGNSIWHYAINSEFNRIAKRDEVTFYLHVKQFRELVSKLASAVDINLKDREGQTAVHLAVKNGNAEKIKAIIALKPNLNAVTSDGDTALSLSAGKPPFYVYLFGQGARNPGKIADCDVAKKLLASINTHDYLKKEDSPEPAVRAAAPKDCFAPEQAAGLN
ncbi:ankyrin repeat domain-containing protein [Bradyrhizobium manausense]|uniref:ankyrin repeat domain-containing protein n=1 Tax=Bradyrhizobium manausense TaxID=989370 RepID=UPI001BAAD396|nr:ankyrin repeat domain-containing protein [Bradyrhizobium manausense]MBR0831350.1 ankyrin repeat domain-containing protein [Bradyrhizobium manausense]